MKKLLTLFLFLLVITGGVFLARDFLSERFIVNNDIIKDIIIKPQQGTITIENYDAVNGWPIKNSKFVIAELHSGRVVEKLITNEDGMAISKLLDYDTEFIITQEKVPLPYKLEQISVAIKIDSENFQVVTRNKMHEHIKDIQRGPDGEITIKEVYIPVDVLMQRPELPNGCEITALTAVLNFYGYAVSKTEMSDVHLPKEPFVRRGGKLFGPNPFKAYAGEPRYERGGFFCYAPPIVKATNSYFEMVGGEHNPYDISGSTREEIIEFLNQGIPVVIWVTLDLSEPRVTYSWYFHDTEELFLAPVNLHAVVLNGYVGDKVYVMDPLQGKIMRDADTFFASYYALGKHAMVVE